MRIAEILLTCLALALATAPAHAGDEPPPEVSQYQYTLFNPVPGDQMRSLGTDRPTKSDWPYTVPAGHFQYEADLANWTYDRYNSSGATGSTIVIGDPVLKLGLSRDADFELALAPLVIVQNANKGTGQRTRSSGFGDIYTRVKVNLMGNDDGDYVLSVVPYIKAPTAGSTIGNGRWEGGAYAPFVILLPDDWYLDVTSEIDILENAARDGTHPNFQNLINLSHTMFGGTTTALVEIWSDVNTDRNVPTQYTLDFAVAWQIRDDLQVDGGIDFGLNKAANDVQPYLGLSQRF